MKVFFCALFLLATSVAAAQSPGSVCFGGNCDDNAAYAGELDYTNVPEGFSTWTDYGRYIGLSAGLDIPDTRPACLSHCYDHAQDALDLCHQRLGEGADDHCVRVWTEALMSCQRRCEDLPH